MRSKEHYLNHFSESRRRSKLVRPIGMSMKSKCKGGEFSDKNIKSPLKKIKAFVQSQNKVDDLQPLISDGEINNYQDIDDLNTVELLANNISNVSLSSRKSVSFKTEDELVEIIEIPSTKNEICGKCDSEFTSSRKLKDHIDRIHSKREWIRCIICEKTVKHEEHFVI